MSDTAITPEETILETPETPTPEEVTPTETSPAPKARDDKRGNDRNKSRRDRGGMREEEKEFREEMLSIDRVTRVTTGGRQLRFRASIVIGDGKGRVGLGIGKSNEVQGAIEKAIRDAKKNLITFPMINGSIPHDVAVNFKSSALFLHPAHPGTGIIAGGSVRKVFAVSGLKDVIAKQHGSPNPITNARVTLRALQALKPMAMTKSFAKSTTPSEAPKAPQKTGTGAKKTPAKKK